MCTEGQQVTITKPSVRAEHGTFTIASLTDAGLRALLVDANGNDLGYAVDVYNLTPVVDIDEAAMVDGIRANIEHAGRSEMRPGDVRRRSNGMVAVTLTRLPYGAGEYRVELYVAATLGARQIHDQTKTFGVDEYRQACEHGNALFDEYNNDHYAGTCVLAA